MNIHHATDNSGILIPQEASIYTVQNCSELCINQTQQIKIIVHNSLCSLAHVGDKQCSDMSKSNSLAKQNVGQQWSDLVSELGRRKIYTTFSNEF